MVSCPVNVILARCHLLQPFISGIEYKLQRRNHFYVFLVLPQKSIFTVRLAGGCRKEAP
jgi:hypothetical protein